MAAPVILTAAVEGLVDEILLRRICQHVGTSLGGVHGRNGKAYILSRINGYNNSARFRHWVVLLDLDNDGACAAAVLPTWLPTPARLMRLRVAVREIESWLLGDRERLAAYLSVSLDDLSNEPERLADPKLEIVNLARKSRRRAIREDMVPIAGSGQTVGPAYTSRMIEFIQNPTAGWRPDVAALSCDSLRRCIRAISLLAQQGFPTN